MADRPAQKLKALFARRADGFSHAGIAVMGVRVGAAGLALAAQVLAARLIGPDGFGSYALVMVWLVLLGHTATVGTNQLICRLVAAYRAQEDAPAIAGLLRFSLALAGGAALAISGLALGVVHFAPFGLSPEMTLLATLGLLIVPLLMVQDFLEAIARGLDKPILGIGPAMFVRHLAIISGVGVVFLTGGSADALTIMGFTIAGVVVSVAVQYGLVRGQLRETIGVAKPVYKVRYWTRTALPIALLDAAETLFNNADVLILGLFAPPEIVAFYFAATRIAQVLGYVPYGISAATAQKYASLAARGEQARLHQLIEYATFASTALTSVGALVLWAGAPALLSLFGPDYTVAAGVVPILALGLVAASALGPGEDVLTMLGEERACAMGFLVALGVTVGLGFALIPNWGMTGAALATAAGLTVRGLVLSSLAWARLGVVLPIGMARIGKKRAVA
jgi:O-antigen/teichoic acid export membrane protein